jgi:hypothetical protein
MPVPSEMKKTVRLGMAETIFVENIANVVATSAPGASP